MYLRTFLAACAAFSLLSLALVAGCAGGIGYGSIASTNLGSPSPSPNPSPSGNPSPSPSPSSSPQGCDQALPPASTEIIGVDLNITGCTDPTYQAVIGYFGGTNVTTAQVISLKASATDAIKFENFDNQPHTAADLGTWTGSYPPNGPSLTATPSPQGMDISTSGFTAGNLNPGTTTKRSYVANVPGVYVFGCAYHYVSNGMRTIIIVM